MGELVSLEIAHRHWMEKKKKASNSALRVMFVSLMLRTLEVYILGSKVFICTNPVLYE